MLRDRAGIIDISNFAKYRCKGPGAAEWLNKVFANNMPKTVGRSCLTPLISVRGGIAGDATVTKTDEDEFWIISSGMAERYHSRFFQMVPLPEGTTFESHTEDMCGFNVAGPKSREMLQRLTNASMDTDDFPFMRSQMIELSVGAGPVGARALMSMRVEKGYGSWSREYSPEYFPHEVGLGPLCKMDKDFLHKDMAAKVMAEPTRENLVLIHIDEAAVSASNADATGGEPIFHNGQGVGRVTSGTYGYTVGMSLALGYVKTGTAVAGDTVEVMVLGHPHKGTILSEPPFDPSGEKLRA